jgi:hypothetical protein
MLVLFACLAVAVVLQALCTVIACAERAVVDESVGRQRLGEKDEALAVLRQQALASWESSEMMSVGTGEGDAEGAVDGVVSDLPESRGWLMSALVRQRPTTSRLTTSAWLERGRDGVDLPLAVLVADEVTATAGRKIPWIEIAGGSGYVGDAGDAGSETGPGAAIHVVRSPLEPLLGPGCTVVDLRNPWRLDSGWANLEPKVADPEDEASGGPAGVVEAIAVSLGPQALWISGRFGRSETLPENSNGLAPDAPVLVVVTGGATLDARYRGDIYGVIVVDDGSVLLDGTTLHGAVFTTRTVSLGVTGRLIFSRSILRWATDRSLNRVRLVPGTRWEGME